MFRPATLLPACCNASRPRPPPQRFARPGGQCGADQNADKAVEAIRGVLDSRRAGAGAPRPQVGIDGFSYGGPIVGARYWVPSLKYFQSRYEVNHELLKALGAAGVALPPAAIPAVVAPPLSADSGRD
jgi:hypothetical protein